MLLVDVPVLLQSTGAIAHGVCVFDFKKRPPIIVLGDVDHVFGRKVHVGLYIGVHILEVRVLALLLVKDRACRIGFLDPRVGLLEGRAISGFVAHGPDDHRGMVFVARERALDAVQVLCLPFGSIGERLVRVVAHAM